MSLDRKFFGNVAQAGDCWEWVGTRLTPAGYGAFYNGKRTMPAHRWAYEYMVATIPSGLVLDHLCRNPPCVNPWHLEPVTTAVNNARGEAGATQRAKTHCPKGHAYDEENTYVYKGRRHCRKCQSARRPRGFDVETWTPPADWLETARVSRYSTQEGVI